MKTRYSGAFEKGFYVKLNNLSTADQNEKNVLKIIKRKSQSRKDRFFMRNIEIYILKVLKKKDKKCTETKRYWKTKIDINESFKKTLVEKYNLNNNFRDCRSFLSDFFLISNLRISETISHSICEFLMKVNKQNIFTYKDENQEKKIISNNSITIKIKRIKESTITKEKKCFLSTFNDLTKKKRF